MTAVGTKACMTWNFSTALWTVMHGLYFSFTLKYDQVFLICLLFEMFVASDGTALLLILQYVTYRRIYIAVFQYLFAIGNSQLHLSPPLLQQTQAYSDSYADKQPCDQIKEKCRCIQNVQRAYGYNNLLLLEQSLESSQHP